MLSGIILSPESPYHNKRGCLHIVGDKISSIRNIDKIDIQHNNRYLMPGLINAHVHHICRGDVGGGENGPESGKELAQ